MIRKTLGTLLLVGLGAALALGWPDIVRFLKLKRLSQGTGGHPELVPVEGRTAYPQVAGAEAKGEGEFDAPSRGGPAPEDGEHRDHVTVLDRARQAVAGLAGRSNMDSENMDANMDRELANCHNG
jgi:hypothetical protein